jgi:heme exporter protein C
LNFNDIDARMRMVFYPAVLGWTLLGFWIANLRIRYNILIEKKMEKP